VPTHLAGVTDCTRLEVRGPPKSCQMGFVTRRSGIADLLLSVVLFGIDICVWLNNSAVCAVG
jgi:hypothetical protein